MALKKFILIIFPLWVLGGLFFYLQSPKDSVNHAKTPLEFKDNTIQCPQCHMFLVGTKHTAQLIDKEGKTTFFDDVGCMILWSKEQNIDLNERVLWVYSNDTLRYIDAKSAYYSVIDETPMQYGFGAYEKSGDTLIDFQEMRLRMLRGENMSNPKIRR